MALPAADVDPTMCDVPLTRPEITLDTLPRCSFQQRARPLYHAFWYHLGERFAWSRGIYRDLPNAQFIVGDYAGYDHSADIVTAWYPFATPNPVLAWRMPLSVLTPYALFSRVAHNLTPHGLFVMVNQGRDEAAIAATWCEKVGLLRYGSCEVRTLLCSRRPAVVSCWTSSHLSHVRPYQN